MTKLERYPDPMKPVELARHWRCSPDTVVRLCEDGEITGAFKVRRQWRIPHSAVLEYEQEANGEAE